MKFRISLKNERSDAAKPVPVSIPHKDAIAIEPPKKVIKALYDWAAPNDTNMYMSFSAGDFLHVLSRENDPDWYEACNPLRNERGLVPVKYFENVGKTVRDSGDSSKSMTGATHDSGYAEGSTPSSQITSAPRTSANGAHPAMMGPPAHRSTKSLAKTGGGVYGVVSYDFHAERPDELDAKEGEAIIVIAQSNPEWFVAKPITRLGGPGLIPVSFIEIRDMTTGQVVEDPVAAVAKAGIPRVEEWKKMAAEYKNTSIPLGSVTSSQLASSMQQGVERMSLNNAQANGYAHGRQPSNAYAQQSQYAPVRAAVPKFVFSEDKFHFVVECQMSNGTHWDLARIYEDFYELQINLKKAFPAEAGDVPGKPRILPYMPGPVQYVTDTISEGRRESLDEYLRDLLRLPQHIALSPLVRNFFTPRDGDYEIDPNEVDLNEHARPMEANVRHSQASQTSYNPGQFSPPSAAAAARQPSISPAHQYSQSTTSNAAYDHQRGQPSQTNASFTHDHQRGQPSLSNAGFTPDHQRGQLSQTNAGFHQPPPSQHFSPPPESTLMAPPPMARQTTSTTMASESSTKTNSQTPGQSHEPVKVKAWFDRNTCVVIRMKPKGEFGFDELYKKILERRKLEFRGQDDQAPLTDDLEIEFRHQSSGEYFPFENDDDLSKALDGTTKITLAVRAAGD